MSTTWRRGDPDAVLLRLLDRAHEAGVEVTAWHEDGCLTGVPGERGAHGDRSVAGVTLSVRCSVVHRRFTTVTAPLPPETPAHDRLAYRLDWQYPATPEHHEWSWGPWSSAALPTETEGART